jgi:aspartate carbamoyltransferase catalytic subunit
MSFRSFIDFADITTFQIEKLFSLAESALKGQLQLATHLKKPLAFLFFEPSTRTRISFEQAAFRLGLSVSLIDGKSGTSLEKDETFEDTFLNICAMKPGAIIVRCSEQFNLKEMSQKVNVPVINAGWGTWSHPTQALLDLFTVMRFKKNFKNMKFVFIGDVKHSRVFHSHVQLASLLGYTVASCGPKNLQSTSVSVQNFDHLKDALAWCDVVVGLRLQKERHQETQAAQANQYQINAESLKFLKKEALIMHPGPVHWGSEFSELVGQDPRSVILEQVTSGVFVRQALLATQLQQFDQSGQEAT